MATVPSITISNTATRTEVWDMFWEAANALHDIRDENLDFGTDKDPSTDSKNLQPHKIFFAPNQRGHDHSMGGGRRLHPDSVSKRNIDINAASVLWADYWSDNLGGDESSKFVIYHGIATFDGDYMPDGTSTAYTDDTTRYVFIQTYPGESVSNDQSNSSSLYIDNGSDYDSTYWDSLEFSVTAILVTAIKGTTSMGTFPLMNVWVGKKAGAWLLATNSTANTDVSVKYVVIGKYTGPRA